MFLAKNSKFYILNSVLLKKGTALLMTVLILNSIIIVALAAAKLIVSGVRESGTETRSIKAYAAAEAGAERTLYEYRKTGVCLKPLFTNCHFTRTLPAGGSSYQADWTSGDGSLGTTLTFISIGASSGLKRSVELDFRY
jgi:hypothetical protein